MKTMERLDFREIANAKISSRLRQAVILLLTIIIGMILSITVNGQDRSQKEKSGFYKTKFKTQINQYAMSDLA